MLSKGRIRGWVAGLFLLQCQAGPAPSAWIRVSSPEIELLTSGDSRIAGAAVSELDGLREEWRAAVPPEDRVGARVRIVAFASEAEYQAFRINTFSPAYFVSGPGQDTIVLGRLAKENFPALRHEFVHHLIRARWRNLPLWMEEGLADYFGGVESGVARARADRLRRRGLTPLDELAAVVKSSASYQDREAALQFYAQSWALAHLLLTEPMYRAEAWALVEMLDRGERLEDAAELVYGRSLMALQLDLATHLGQLDGGRAAVRSGPIAAAAVAAGADEVGLALARLLLRKSDTGGAQRLLEGVSESSRGNPELWSLTGDLALRQGRPLEARFALQEALRLGSRDARGLRQLAVLEQNAMNSAALEPILERLVEADPSDQAARRALYALQAPR
jgi:Protein of unknown function (DUF1570)